MSRKNFIIAATVADGFWRCGKHFTQAGVPVREDEFDETQWDILNAEPKLRVTLATADDVADVDGRAALIAEAITTLTDDDFQRDGKPKVDALNALLGDELSKITADERNMVWTTVQANGFEAPTSN